MQKVPRGVLLGVFFSALILEALVLYFLDDRSLRLYVGLALLLPICWMFARTQVAEVISDLPISVKRRSYSAMRAQTTLLLDEIRRLNWLAVDVDRGFRSREEAKGEMDAIEARLGDLILEVRRTAGQVSEPEELQTAPVPDETSPDETSSDETSEGTG